MKEERKLILKLGQMITDRVGVKVTVEDPEYWGLAEVLTDEMAEVCLSMKVRKPMTLEQIARKSGKDPERVQKLLDEMSVIGMIEYNWENADHHKQYVLPMFVPGCAEFMMMNDKQVEEHPILADFFENMSRLPLEKVTPMVPPGGSGIGMHVIPVEKAIPAKSDPVSMASAASRSVRLATNLRIFFPISSMAFSAMASENGDAAVETYASSAWINASIPHAAATEAGADVRSSGSSIA